MAIITVLLVAIFTEAITEWIKLAFPMLHEKDTYIYLITAVVGIGICFGANVGILHAAGVECNVYLDFVCSGIIISRGSNYVFDLMKKLRDTKDTDPVGIDEEDKGVM